MGKQARIKSLRKFIKDHAKKQGTTPQNVAATILSNSDGGNRSSDSNIAAWYFIRKGLSQ